jgi:hypothetical protein
MAITNTKLPRGPFANVAYAPLNQTRVVTTMYLCNTSANVAATANVYLVPAQSNPADPFGSLVYTNITLAPNDTYVIDGERIVLENGDSIFANISTGTASAVVMTVSSVGA